MTKGNWKGVYGSQGYNNINDALSYPSYAQITVTGSTSPTWDDSTTDVRALQKAVGTDRVAARWSANSSFTIDLTMTDGLAHRVALYCLDWDGNNRSQRIDIFDSNSNALLDTRSISAFNGGQYLVWDIRGRVRITITRTGAKTAVLSGFYFGTAGTLSSAASVEQARIRANDLLNEMGTDPSFGGGGSAFTPSTLATALLGLVDDVQSAYSAFQSEQSSFAPNASRINAQLQAALYLSKADAALASRVGSSTGVRDHLLRIAAHLAVAEDLIVFGSVSSATQTQAAAANARLDVAIGPASAAYTMNGPSQIAPLSLGSVFGDAAISPLSSQTLFAPIGAGGTVPYELGGVNVTVAGKAVPVTFVSSSRVSFQVAPDIAPGVAEVIVVSQSGFISRGFADIAANATRLMTVNESDNGSAIALNANNQLQSSFALLTAENFGSDKRTRVMFYATGVSGSAINSNPWNDIQVDGLLRQNFAEAVIVEARLGNGTVINLPVEFAGRQGTLPGLDQVNVVLTSQLSGAGSVSLTLIVGGQRSNAGIIVVQ